MCHQVPVELHISACLHRGWRVGAGQLWVWPHGEGLGWLCAATSALQVMGRELLELQEERRGEEVTGGAFGAVLCCHSGVWLCGRGWEKGLVLCAGWGVLSSGSQQCHSNVTQMSQHGDSKPPTLPCRNSCCCSLSSFTHLGGDPKPCLSPTSSHLRLWSCSLSLCPFLILTWGQLVTNKFLCFN